MAAEDEIKGAAGNPAVGWGVGIILIVVGVMFAVWFLRKFFKDTFGSIFDGIASMFGFKDAGAAAESYGYRTSEGQNDPTLAWNQAAIKWCESHNIDRNLRFNPDVMKGFPTLEQWKRGITSLQTY